MVGVPVLFYALSKPSYRPFWQPTACPLGQRLENDYYEGEDEDESLYCGLGLGRALDVSMVTKVYET